MKYTSHERSTPPNPKPAINQRRLCRCWPPPSGVRSAPSTRPPADAYGLTPVTIVFWRAALAALGLGFALLVVVPLAGGGWHRLRVRAADWPIFITFGLLGVTAFYILYIYAVLLVGVAVSVVLLYTSPVFVAVLSWRFLGEPFRRRKTLALILTLTGCILVARAYDPSLLQVNWLGILCGLGSGFTYALYDILGKLSLHRGYTIGVMSFYVYAIGALGLLAVSFFGEGGPPPSSRWKTPGAWLLLSAVALFATIGALYLYTAGLRHLQAGVASILATFEPVVATSGLLRGRRNNRMASNRRRMYDNYLSSGRSAARMRINI